MAFFIVVLVRSRAAKLFQLALDVILFSFIASTWHYLSNYTEQLLMLTAAVVLYLGLMFRRHYWACTLGTGFANIKRPQVRRRAIVPAFFDAVESWFCYGQLGTALPGMRRSLAGSCAHRVLITKAVFFLLLFVAPTIPQRLYFQDGVVFPMERIAFLALLCSYLAPLTIILVACCVVSADQLGLCYAVKEAERSDNLLPEVFHELNDTLRNSRNADERDSIYWGRVVSDGSPVFLPMKVLMAHMLLVGSTMSGKTARLQYLLESLLLRGDTSIIVLDLKADTFELLQSMLAIAPIVRERLGVSLPVKRLSNRHGHSSHVFSQADQEHWLNLTQIQRVDVQQAAMAIPTGTAYGVSWFAHADFAVQMHVANKYPDIRDFGELSDRLAYELQQKDSSEESVGQISGPTGV
jgi:hypothetical protein